MSNTPTVHHGDCLEVLRSLPDASVDAVVTDPPYALSFMGKAWDSHDTPIGFQAWCQLWAVECLRVLKPGGHMLAFGGTRTWHRLACAVEDAGFEVRDSIAWMYGSGFPKSLDVSKAIDKRRDEDREPRVRVTSWVAAECARLGWTRRRLCDAFGVANQPIQSWTETNPAYAVVPTWENWQRLKSLVGFGDDMDAEVLRLNGRKGTHGEAWQNAEVVGIREGAMSNWNMDGSTKFVDREEKAPATDAARTWQGWGTALKPAFEPIVVARKPLVGTVAGNVLAHGTGALNIDGCRVAASGRPPIESKSEASVSTFGDGLNGSRHAGATDLGRWPANVILDEDQADALDQQTGHLHSAGPAQTGGNDRNAASSMFGIGNATGAQIRLGDKGGASRFYYVAKAGKKERPIVDGTAHPTVKPLALMRWLVRLVTPPGGTVLEPFAGSGTTVEACILEGFNVIAIEREADYLPLIQSRIFRAQAAVAVEPEPDLFSELDGEAS